MRILPRTVFDKSKVLKIFLRERIISQLVIVLHTISSCHEGLVTYWNTARFLFGVQVYLIMFGFSNYNKVLDSVIFFITIPVVNKLIFTKIPSKMLFHYKSVFKNPRLVVFTCLPSRMIERGRNLYISIFCYRFTSFIKGIIFTNLPRAITNHITKFSFSTLRMFGFFATKKTFNYHLLYNNSYL